MPGQHGNTICTIASQPVVKIVVEDDLILIEGGVPGKGNGIVTVRGAVKKHGGKVNAKADAKAARAAKA
jgi:large subunit ribosomal protein L3